MGVRLKRLSEQVIVVTGATSGIGLATVRAAAGRGAKVVAIARNAAMLGELVEELGRDGRQAVAYDCDVADAATLADCARRAVERFGRIDTWVNNAGVSVYAKLADVPLDDAKRVFDTNFWGVVNGCNAALPHLAHGGAIVNVGSEASALSLPLQGIYAASKHAVKAYTDALRMELMNEGRPIAVTLVRPTAIDTPYPSHAGNHLGVAPRLPGPLLTPEVVADAILFAAEHPRRDLYVGGRARLSTLMAQLAPGLTDRLAAATGVRTQTTGARQPPTAGGLYESRSSLTERGNADGIVFSHSPYTAVSKHRGAVALAVLAAGALWLASRSPSLRGWGRRARRIV